MAREHVTRLIFKLSLDPENRIALSKAGAIPQLAYQLRDGTPAAMSAAASALAQLSLKSAAKGAALKGRAQQERNQHDCVGAFLHHRHCR